MKQEIAPPRVSRVATSPTPLVARDRTVRGLKNANSGGIPAKKPGTKPPKVNSPNREVAGPHKEGLRLSKDQADESRVASSKAKSAHTARTRRTVSQDARNEVAEWRTKFEESESVVCGFRSEIEKLREEVGRLQSVNDELEMRNKKLAEELKAAKEEISNFERDVRKDEPDPDAVSFNGLKEVQKVASGALECNGEEREVYAVTMKMEALKPVIKPSESKPKTVQPHPLPPPPPPPPPPPTPQQTLLRPASVQKAPSLMELYHSLTKRESKKDLAGSGNSSSPVAMTAHSSIVGEIQNRSAYLLAIKADVEKKGELIKFLIQKVRNAAFTDVEDVLRFVDWLDSELSSLADERAVLKYFDWPERKADAMREAAFEYRDLKRLQSEVSSYEDNPSMSCETALKKMTNLLNKAEYGIQRLMKLRETTIQSYKDNKIPTDWMLDSGILLSKTKQASVKLAKTYMKRVSMELESVKHFERESMQEGLLIQGVRFAYRAHQFAGGLDAEAMRALEEVRQRVPVMQGRGSRELLVGVTS